MIIVNNHGQASDGMYISSTVTHTDLTVKVDGRLKDAVHAAGRPRAGCRDVEEGVEVLPTPREVTFAFKGHVMGGVVT